LILFPGGTKCADVYGAHVPFGGDERMDWRKPAISPIRAASQAPFRPPLWKVFEGRQRAALDAYQTVARVEERLVEARPVGIEGSAGVEDAIISCAPSSHELARAGERRERCS
jgi:hypothetical protein